MDETIPEPLLAAAKLFFSRYPPTRSLCETDDDAPRVSHILRIRAEALRVHDYPCISMLSFLRPTLTQSRLYHSVILPKLSQSKAVFLDVGCCFGQVIRRLVADGADPENLIGTDLHQDFIEFGYKLFRDGTQVDDGPALKSLFKAGDIFDETFLADLHRRVDILHIASVFHLFSWDMQVQLAYRLHNLLSTTPESIIIGSLLGVKDAGELRAGDEGSAFRQNAETFRRLWGNVGQGKWVVDVSEEVLNLDLKRHPVKLIKPGEELLLLRFVVKRQL